MRHIWLTLLALLALADLAAHEAAGAAKDWLWGR